MSVEAVKITIGEKEFELSPLRLKHIKAITSMVGQPAPTSIIASLARWTPYLLDSIKVKNPDFKEEDLDEATLPELTAASDALLVVSGLVIKKQGEATPE